MKKDKIYRCSNDLSYIRADEFIQRLKDFAQIYGVKLSDIEIETDGYESSGIIATTYSLETDFEYAQRVEREEVARKRNEENDRKKFEELKKRFG